MNNSILIHHKNVPENINVHFADSNIIEFTYCNSKFRNIDEYISNYEEAILTEKLAEANLVMAQQDLDKQMQELDETVAGVRRYVIDCIINNEENAEAMKELAQKLIAGEKENDVYDQNNWKEIL